MKSGETEPPVVEWWVVGDREGRVSTGAASSQPAVHEVAATRSADLWVAALDGLPTTDFIAYKVRGELGETEPHVFRIGVPPGESFRFAAFGDTRTNHHVHRAVIEAMAREKIEFVVHTGDMVDRGGIQSQWDRFFQIERPLLIKTPIVPAIGNHDMSARRYFRHYFMHNRWTKSRRYFVHDWGNLRIVIIDGGIECRDGCAQYVFAERALAEGVRQGKLMAMMLHYPPYSSGAHGSHEGVQESISELARRYGVELVIAGHDHNYERTKPIDGVTYVVSGSAGAPIRPVNPRWFTAEARTEPHYVLIDVESNRMILRAVNLKGDTFDTAVLEDNPPQAK
jgi:predicted phosphodiesterase